jgi:acetyl esterase/lipase
MVGRDESFDPPRRLGRAHVVARTTVEGSACFTVASKRSPSSARRILYLHGGSFIREISPFHWRFVARLVDATNATALVPIYPLPPRGDHRDVFRVLTAVYRRVLETSAPGDVTVMGDSAGGTMALALPGYHRSQDLPPPRRLVALSPCLDLRLSNPEIAAVDSLDPWLSAPGAVEAHSFYANGTDMRDPLLSPIHGSLVDLPPVHLFIGTHDILEPDCRRFRRLAEDAGIDLDYVEEEGAFHVWMLVPLLPEARRTFAQIVDILLDRRTPEPARES